jgi:hypothetical protein
MSTDFIGLFDVTTPGVSAEWLLERLVQDPPALTEVIHRYRELWLAKSWVCQPSRVTGTVDLHGPGGFLFRFAPRIVEVYHVVRFRVFAGNSEEREALRRVWHLLAELFGSPRAIYTHELMPHEGTNLSEIETGLRTGIGPPADNFDELLEAEYFHPRAWYIDDFADLAPRDKSAMQIG